MTKFRDGDGEGRSKAAREQEGRRYLVRRPPRILMGEQVRERVGRRVSYKYTTQYEHKRKRDFQGTAATEKKDATTMLQSIRARTMGPLSCSVDTGKSPSRLHNGGGLNQLHAHARIVQSPSLPVSLVASLPCQWTAKSREGGERRTIEGGGGGGVVVCTVNFSGRGGG